MKVQIFVNFLSIFYFQVFFIHIIDFIIHIHTKRVMYMSIQSIQSIQSQGQVLCILPFWYLCTQKLGEILFSAIISTVFLYFSFLPQKTQEEKLKLLKKCFKLLSDALGASLNKLQLRKILLFLFSAVNTTPLPLSLAVTALSKPNTLLSLLAQMLSTSTQTLQGNT